MSNDPIDCPRIDPVPPGRRGEALRLLLSRFPAEDRQSQLDVLLDEVSDEKASSEALLGAFRDDRLVGVVHGQLQPGKTAVVWPPRIASPEPVTSATRLLEAACKVLARRDVRLAQVLLYVDDPGDDATLRSGGFEFLGDLLYLVSPEDEFPEAMPETPLDFEPYSVDNHGRLARVMDATYHQTLDCPRLNGVRQIEDVLAGYRAAGAFDPSRWLIVRHGGQDVGCLLLTDHPRHENWELAYMGVAASTRGCGWGSHITRHAQWLTRQAGRPRLVLAVDAANEPAIKMYTAAGFQTWDRRRVYVRVFPPTG